MDGDDFAKAMVEKNEQPPTNLNSHIKTPQTSTFESTELIESEKLKVTHVIVIIRLLFKEVAAVVQRSWGNQRSQQLRE